MTGPMLALLPSPLLGAAAWEPVAGELRALGHEVVVAPVPPAPETPADVLAMFLDALPTDRQIVLVPHSNAGLYVPALTEARDVVGAVFTDAALPDDAEATAMAPAALRDQVAALAGSDGRLPPWTRWWPDADVAALFPSAEVRAAVEAGEPRLSLAYFDSSLPVPVHWDDVPCAYLLFGDTYAPERAVAEARGWPVASLPGHHLHLLVEPADVARILDYLVHQLSR